jgi:hypothetical protein
LIIAETNFCDVVLTLFNLFFITGPIEDLFLKGIVHIKGACLMGGIERSSYMEDSKKV